MNIIKYPNSILHEKCDEIVDFNNFQLIIDELVADCKKYHGYAIAAPQVGILKRFFVTIVKDVPSFIANPIIKNMTNKTRYKESCLSIPDVPAWSDRFSELDLEYQDESGTKKELHASGLSAIMIQHEVDHLNGVLFIENLNFIEKEKIIKKLNKLRGRK